MHLNLFSFCGNVCHKRLSFLFLIFFQTYPCQDPYIRCVLISSCFLFWVHLVLDVGFWVHLGLVRFDVLMGVNVLVRMMNFICCDEHLG